MACLLRVCLASRCPVRACAGWRGFGVDAGGGRVEQGAPVPNTDFRGLYSTIVEDWLGLDAQPIVDGAFEKPAFL